MGRWSEIAYAVLENLNELGIRDVNVERIFVELKTTQREVARDGLALPGSTTITTVIGQTDYAVPATVFKINKIFRPAAWLKPIVIVHDDEEWLRIVSDTTIVDTQPLFITMWNGGLIFYPAPSDVQTVPLWTYNLPSSDPAIGTDPEFNSKWDRALQFGAAADFAANKKASDPNFNEGLWAAKYRAEIAAKKGQSFKRMIDGQQGVDHSSKRLGF